MLNAVPRFHRTKKSTLLTICCEEDKWHLCLGQIQLSINNVQSKSTGQSASGLMHGFRPRCGMDMELIDEICKTPKMIKDVISVRQKVCERLEREAKAIF